MTTMALIQQEIFIIIAQMINVDYASENEKNLIISAQAQEQQDSLNDTSKGKTIISNSQRESSIGRQKILSRRPDSRQSNFSSYKNQRRKSQEKNSKEVVEGSPQKTVTFLVQNRAAQNDCSQLKKKEITKQDLNNKFETVSAQMRRFKKKAMSKQQIIDIKDYVQSINDQLNRQLSEAATDQPVNNTPIDFAARSPKNKSRTQYFQIENFQQFEFLQEQNGQNLTQRQKNYIASLKQKCKSVDQNNNLLQKRIQWLREQLQMNLQRQNKYEKKLNKYKKNLQGKDVKIIQLERINQQTKDSYQKEIIQKDKEIKLYKFQIETLEHQVQEQHEFFQTQIQIYSAQKTKDFEQKQVKYLKKIEDLDLRVNQLLSQLQQQKNASTIQIQENSILNSEVHSKTLVESLLKQNKYLKLQNHMLARYKYEANELKKQNKKISFEHKSLKKKMLQNARKQLKRFKQQSQFPDDSELFSLSEASISQVANESLDS